VCITEEEKASMNIGPKFCKEQGLLGSLIPLLGDGATERRIEVSGGKKIGAEISSCLPIYISFLA
jgi:hypothetical protein